MFCSMLTAKTGLALMYFTASVLLLSACTSTDRQRKEGELALLKQATEQSTLVLNEMRAGKFPPEYDVHLYFAYDVVNKALEALDHYSFSLPNDPSVTVTIKNVRVSGRGALPNISLSSSAHKQNLHADLEVGIVLVPAEGNSNGAKLRMKVVSFVPKVSWWIFELTKSKFVNALLNVELAKISEKLPLIELPVSQKVKFGSASATRRESIPTGRGSTLDLDITIPETTREREIAIVRYAFLETGLHILGSIK